MNMMKKIASDFRVKSDSGVKFFWVEKLKHAVCFSLIMCLFFSFSAITFASINIVSPFVKVYVKNVAVGKKFSLVKHGYPALKIYNKGNEKIRVKITTRAGSGRIFVRPEKSVFEIEPGSFAETNIVIFVPKKKENYGKKFEAEILSVGKSSGNVSAGLRSKLIFETVKRKNLWQKIMEVFSNE